MYIFTCYAFYSRVFLTRAFDKGDWETTPNAPNLKWIYSGAHY